MLSFKQFITEAGASAERQENGFVDAINDAIKQNDGKPINVSSKDSTVRGVVKAEKFTGRQRSGSEPYTDVVLYTTRGQINISMKGPSAPSLAGGGLRGVEAILPGIGAKFYRAVLDNHLKNGLKPGDKVPDTYAKLNDKDKLLLVVGNTAIGGPVDFMYIGPMTVVSKYKNGTLQVNGSLIDATKYAKTHDLFFRLRARRVDQTFDPKAVDKNNQPKIYSKSPSKGDSAGRLVITDKVPSAGNIIVI
jgi:hypothetical protein